jgi:CheY-like chemotaxis protein
MGERQTVLIVDDDPQILHLVEKMLGARPVKVNVLVAPRPSKALQICEAHPVHVLITDMAMPEMDGTKLAERVLKLQPNVKILLISGHYKDPPPCAGTGRVRFLKKPFFPSQLLEHLRELLAEGLGAA